MRIGTRSVLFGAHQFILHPIFVFIAWWMLYGFPRDPRLWVAFIVHDLGYLGKPNMDGPEGETHPELGARIMRWLFDKPFNAAAWDCPHPECIAGFLGSDEEHYFFGTVPPPCPICERLERESRHWHDFTLYHSRFYAKKHRANHSRLCVADKLATVLMPWWLYLPLVNLTGEVREYMCIFKAKEGGKYANMERLRAIENADQRAWFENMTDYMRRWVAEHQDCRPDTWTPAV